MPIEKSKTLYYNKAKKQQVTEHEDGSIEARSQESTFKIDKTGNIEARTAAGIFKTEDGNVTINLERITSVGFSNIMELRAYSISHDGDVINHLFEFMDGGKGELSYRAIGKLEKFGSTGGVTVSVSPDGKMILSQKTVLRSDLTTH